MERTSQVLAMRAPGSDWMGLARRLGHRSKLVGEIVGAAIQAVGAIARRALARHRQRRQARTVSDLLHQLDGRTLRDLGFDRSEITSVAAELTGAAESTRVRALQTSPGLPK